MFGFCPPLRRPGEFETREPPTRSWFGHRFQLCLSAAITETPAAKKDDSSSSSEEVTAEKIDQVKADLQKALDPQEAAEFSEITNSFAPGTSEKEHTEGMVRTLDWRVDGVVSFCWNSPFRSICCCWLSNPRKRTRLCVLSSTSLSTLQKLRSKLKRR